MIGVAGESRSPAQGGNPGLDVLKQQLCTEVQGEVLFDEPLRLYTSLRIGGPADILVSPAGVADLRTVMRLTHWHRVPVTIIGHGTNVLVADEGVAGCVVRIGRSMGAISHMAGGLRAEAGVPLPKLAREAARLGLAGLEFAGGIPGTVGGAVVMNAGAHDADISKIVSEIETVNAGGEINALTAAQMDYGYRTSALRRDHTLAVAAAAFRLLPGDQNVIYERMQAFAARRRRTQPQGQPSAGSVFQNPPGGYAGRLIEQCGLKGTAVGGAAVSPLHANFIVNTGGASAGDVMALISLIRQRVAEMCGVHLELELELIGVRE